MRAGDSGKLIGDLAPSLLGVKITVLSVSSNYPYSMVTVILLENGNGISCWKAGDIIPVQYRNILIKESHEQSRKDSVRDT